MVDRHLESFTIRVDFSCSWSWSSCVYVVSVAWSLHDIGMNIERLFERAVTTSVEAFEASGSVPPIVLQSTNDLWGYLDINFNRFLYGLYIFAHIPQEIPENVNWNFISSANFIDKRSRLFLPKPAS